MEIILAIITIKDKRVTSPLHRILPSIYDNSSRIQLFFHKSQPFSIIIELTIKSFSLGIIANSLECINSFY